MRHVLLSFLGLVCGGGLLISCSGGSGTDSGGTLKNSYIQHNFVANNAATYQPEIATEPNFIDTWGIAIRPAGIPGHFWVVSGDRAYEYVGDVTGKVVAPCAIDSALCPDLAPLPNNEVSFPDFPVGADGRPDIVNNHGTGVVFNSNPTSFVITQMPSPASTDLSPVTSGAKFLFATNYGAIYAWTERKHADGTFDRSATALKVFDARATGDGGQFYGLVLSPASDRLYAADFGGSFSVRVFSNVLSGGQLQEITANLNGFKNPFAADPANIRAGDFVPWNVQLVGSSIFVAYAQVKQDPSAATGTPFPANEVHAAGAGRLAEFDLDGKLIAIWDDGGLLDAPWGMAMAPANFGALSNTLLVGNFGDYDGVNKGAIVAFDVGRKKAVNYMRNPDGSPLLLPGVWGLLFGNGDTLGDANALYFGAGPNGELDGLFGSLRYGTGN